MISENYEKCLFTIIMKQSPYLNDFTTASYYHQQCHPESTQHICIIIHINTLISLLSIDHMLSKCVTIRIINSTHLSKVKHQKGVKILLSSDRTTGG